MKHLLSINALVIGFILTFNSVSATENSGMGCYTGPVKKVYGDANWLVYSCSDNKSLVVVSDTGNPAMPFYFSFQKIDGAYRLTGEGSGDKSTTKAAFNELKSLSGDDIQKLLAETKSQ
ncbi:hypothetical protein [Kangiella shandongensis]|uniref:hypothetical protein n=1 Tax=Kangiella shandongensis TaxID=2763258 RepID=UPI001CBF842F|nr:hypothetical protein [Kangiella shandongensis]